MAKCVAAANIFIWILIDAISSTEVSFTRNAVSWSAATFNCTKAAGTMPALSYDNVKELSLTKRAAHLKMGDTAWVGVYSKLNKTKVVQDNYTNILCSTIEITDIIPTTDAFIYTYRVMVAECGQLHPAVCLHSAGERRFLQKTVSPQTRQLASSTCAKFPGELWTPNITISRDDGSTNSIGRGHIELKATTPYFSSGATFWVQPTYWEEKFKSPVSGLPFRCGFLRYTNPNINLDNCNTKRGYICSNANVSTETTGSPSTMFVSAKLPTTTGGVFDVHHHQSMVGNSDTGSLAVYIVVPVAVVVVIVVTAAVVLLWKRKSRDSILRKKEPSGGRSFKRPDSSSDATPSQTTCPEDNRLTLYAKINPAHVSDNLEMTLSSANVGAVVGDINDSEYAVINIPKSRNNTPDVVPRHITTGYLAMDNHSRNTDSQQTEDAYDNNRNADLKQAQPENSYDTTESVRRNGNTSGNISETGHVYGYSTPNDDATYAEALVDSVYDSTLRRHGSQKPLIDTYDHVSISMSRDVDVCNSVEINTQVYSSTDSSTRRVFNPGYDRVDIH